MPNKSTVHVNMVLGAVTCSGKLSLIVEYAEESVDTTTMEKIKNKAMEYLLHELKLKEKLH